MKDIWKYIALGRKVYKYVEEQNSKGEYPTVRELARKYKLKNDEIITLVEDNDDLGYNIGIRVGSGHYVEKYKGDYTVEVTD